MPLAVANKGGYSCKTLTLVIFVFVHFMYVFGFGFVHFQYLIKYENIEFHTHICICCNAPFSDSLTFHTVRLLIGTIDQVDFLIRMCVTDLQSCKRTFPYICVCVCGFAYPNVCYRCTILQENISLCVCVCVCVGWVWLGEK